MWTVQDVDDGASDGYEKDEQEEEKGEPDAEGAAAASALAATWVGLGAVGGACGSVELRLSGRESSVGGGGGAVGSGLGRGIDPVCHGVYACASLSERERERDEKGIESLLVCVLRGKRKAVCFGGCRGS